MSKLDALAKALGVDPVSLIDAARPFVDWGRALGVTPLELLKTTIQNFDATHDGRAVPWRVRLRLYRDGTLDPIADTDPDLAPDAAGTDIVRGLNGVSYWAARIARDFHDPIDLGVGFEEEFLKRIPSVRPALSRRNGNAAWRIPYRCNGQDWLARIDLVREQPAANAVETIGMRDLLTKLRAEV